MWGSTWSNQCTVVELLYDCSLDDELRNSSSDYEVLMAVIENTSSSHHQTKNINENNRWSGTGRIQRYDATTCEGRANREHILWKVRWARKFGEIHNLCKLLYTTSGEEPNDDARMEWGFHTGGICGYRSMQSRRYDLQGRHLSINMPYRCSLLWFCGVRSMFLSHHASLGAEDHRPTSTGDSPVSSIEHASNLPANTQKL